MATEIPQLPTQYNVIFSSGNSIVQFVDPLTGFAQQTLWWVDADTKKLIPFTSETAFQNFFLKTYGVPLTVDDAFKYGAVNQVHSDALTNGNLSEFQMLKGEEGIVEDGTFKSISADIGSESLQNSYGKDKNSDQFQNLGLHPLDGLLGWMPQAAGVDQSFVDKVKSDSALTGFYSNALAYGGYSIGDVTKDIKRRFLIANGQTELQNIQVISPTQDAKSYYNTAERQKANASSVLDLPRSIRGLPDYVYNLPIAQLPDDVFKQLVPPLDFNTPEGKAAMDNIKLAYADVLDQMLSAKTDRDQAMAETAYNSFRDQLQNNFNITLSDNAFTAWDQIQSIMSTSTSSGLANTGIETEQLQDYLAKVRRTNQVARDQNSTQANDAKMKYYTSSASPQKIKDDLASGKVTQEELQKWGMMPTAEQKNFFSAASLKAAYPNLSDQEIKDYQNFIIDENGFFRSSLYQNLFENRYTLAQQKLGIQQATAQQKNTNDEQNAFDAAANAPQSSANTNGEIKSTNPYSNLAYKSDGKTVYNKDTGYIYSTPEDLATRTGINDASKIDWSQIGGYVAPPVTNNGGFPTSPVSNNGGFPTSPVSNNGGFPTSNTTDPYDLTKRYAMVGDAVYKAGSTTPFSTQQDFLTDAKISGADTQNWNTKYKFSSSLI